MFLFLHFLFPKNVLFNESKCFIWVICFLNLIYNQLMKLDEKMSFKDKFDYKKKLVVGIIVFVVWLLFVYFTTEFSSSGFIPASDACYSFFMSICLLIPSILLLILFKNEQAGKILKYIIYVMLIIFLGYCLLCIPATHGPFILYYILAIAFIIINYMG